MTRLLRAGTWLSEPIERLRAGRFPVRMVAGLALLAGTLAIGAIGLSGPPSSGSLGDRAGSSGSYAADPATARDGESSPPVPAFGGTLDTGLGGVIDIAGKGVLVLALLLLTLRLMHRMSSVGGSAAAQMVVLESRPLAQRASLHLVAIGERRLVVGLTPGGIVPLAELTADELPDPATGVGDGGRSPVPGPASSGPVDRFARVAADLARRRGVTR